MNKKNHDTQGQRIGFYFGSSSAVITTAGLLVGLHAGTQSMATVYSGIIIIAIADAMADALGIHLAQESETSSSRQIWQATLTTFFSKCLITLSFLIPLMCVAAPLAIYLSLAWAATIITLLSIGLARSKQKPAMPIVTEHLAIASLVIGLSWWVGQLCRNFFVTV